MSWHKITYNKEAGQGTYVLKMEPGARSKLHEHINFEEFIMLEGELIDPDNKILKKGEIWRWDGYVSKGKQNNSTKAILDQLKNRRIKQLSAQDKLRAILNSNYNTKSFL